VRPSTRSSTVIVHDLSYLQAHWFTLCKGGPTNGPTSHFEDKKGTFGEGPDAY